MNERRGGLRLRRLEDRLTRYLGWLLRSLQKEVEIELDRTWSGPEGHGQTLAEAKGAVWQRLRAEQVAFHPFLQRICRNLRPLRRDEVHCFDLVRRFVRSRRQFLLGWIQSSGPFTRGA
jgi:hypothetical protein